MITRHSITREGSVVMAQVENEYFWGDANPALIYTLQPLTSALLNGFETSLTPIVNKLYRLEVLTPAAAGPSINAVGLFLKREDGISLEETLNLGLRLRERESSITVTRPT